MRTRGQQSNDQKYFSATWQQQLSEAADDLCFLLQRGYAENAALQLVGNQYRLHKRQRDALSRIVCSHQQQELRKAKKVAPQDIKGKKIEIDGFNLLILWESYFSGAYIFKGRDGSYKDLSGIHGSYKRVTHTEKALRICAQMLKSYQAASICWYLDQPVSNSGKLKQMIETIGKEETCAWEVSLVMDPDKVLSASDAIIISADGMILDQANAWFNISEHLFDKEKNPNILAL